MSKIDDGGPAFGTTPLDPYPNLQNVAVVRKVADGMTLRDYTAIKAGALMLAKYSLHQLDESLARTVASKAYLFADAMLAERSKQS